MRKQSNLKIEGSASHTHKYIKINIVYIIKYLKTKDTK